MKAEPSAYAVLGLRPGAGPVAIEAAYRRLIKLHHPDRSGGDGRRAAEINSAYQELRRQFGDHLGGRRGPPVPVRPPRPPDRRRGQLLALGLMAAAAALMIKERDGIRQAIRGPATAAVQPWPAGAPVERVIQPTQDAADAPLDAIGIDHSVLDAIRIAAISGENGLAEQSRACHRQLHRDPSPSRLDRCIAFDEAAIALLGGDPFAVDGPFSASAVTARQVAAARLISSDTLAVESRLARVRTRVELGLAPPEPQPRPVAAGSG